MVTMGFTEEIAKRALDSTLHLPSAIEAALKMADSENSEQMPLWAVISYHKSRMRRVYRPASKQILDEMKCAVCSRAFWCGKLWNKIATW